MTPFSRRPLPLAIALVLCLMLAAGAQAKMKAGAWPQASSDVKPDPRILFGALPNGMRYAILKNDTPPGSASIRFYIAAGSLMESDSQQGLAHLLEHMAFDGSTHVPNGEMVKILERHGLAFGADTNAQTSYDSTVFKLDLPKADASSLSDSLMLLREIAGNLTLAQSAIDKEKGVVLSEERTRDTPQYRAFVDRLGFILAGERAPEREPIGKVAVVAHAQRSQLENLYRAFYRPDRATLIVVGDVDPQAVLGEIRSRFSDWTGVGRAGKDPDLGRIEKRGPSFDLAVQPGTAMTIQVAWEEPPDLSADSLAKRRRILIDTLGLEVLDRRLSDLARSADPPFISAAAVRRNIVKSARVASLLVLSDPDQWKLSLAAALAEERATTRYGVTAEELSREIAENRAELRQAAADQPTRKSDQVADEIAGTIDEEEVETSPVQDLAFFEATVKTVTPDEVSKALKAMFEGQGPLVFISSPQTLAGGEAAVRTAFEADEKSPIAPPAAQTAANWPYLDFGEPTKVVERKDVLDLGTVFIRFANGVVLTVKPTKFRDDEVDVEVRAGDGLESLSPKTQDMAWAGYALTEGGFGKLSAEDAERALAAQVWGANFRVQEDAFALIGTTTRDDLTTELQALAAYLTDPGWRPAGLERVKAYASTLQDQEEHSDTGVLNLDLPGLLHDGDERWTFPSRSEIAAASLDQLKAQVAPFFTSPIEVVIVGDITVEEAIDAAERTFGALAPRVPSASSKVISPRFPAPSPQPVILRHKGRADQAIAVEAWPTQGFYESPRQAREMAILGEVLQIRLRDKLRLSESMTYSPTVSYDASVYWPNWGFIDAVVEAPPAKLSKVFANIETIAQKLSSDLVTPDELERAKKPKIDAVEKAQATNAYWLAALAGAQADPRRLTVIRSEIAGLERVTAEDVRDAARRWLTPSKAWKLEILPSSSS